jgi:murein DD-endopeptidase MepM/ murein hydrolase activator NlpD
MSLTFPLQTNRIRRDGPHEALGNSFGKVRSNFTKWHHGWDLAAPPNTPIQAVAPGKLVRRLSGVNGDGNCLVLEFDNPRYQNGLRASLGIANCEKLYALYAHLNHMSATGPVSQGQIIGSTGTSGNAIGEPPHLHFEILMENTLTHATPRVDPGELLGYALYQC